MKLNYLISILISITFLGSSSLFAQKENVLLYGNAFGQSDLLNDLKKNDFQTSVLTSAQLLELNVNAGKLLIIAGDSPCPPESRIVISKYLSEGGNMIVIGSNVFNYLPVPVKPVSVVSFDNSKKYKILKPLRKPRLGSLEQPKITPINISGKETGLQFITKEKGMPDVLVQFPIKEKASASRSVLTFKAKGNHYMDLLALEIIDSDGKKWITFTPLTNTWENYVVSLADFIPQGWSDSKKLYPLLNPAKVDSLSMGTNMMTVWREKPMAFSISNVALAENGKQIYAPTSIISTLRLPFLENKIILPDWINDPFFKSQPLNGQMTLIQTENSPFGAVEYKNIKTVTSLPESLVEFPGSLMGTDTKKAYDKRNEREKRSITILKTANGQTVGRLDIHTGGIYNRSTIGAFGIEPAEFMARPELLSSLVKVSDYILRKPRVVATTVNTTMQRAEENVVPKFKVTLQNPTAQDINGKLILDIDGMARKEVQVTLPKEQSIDKDIQLSEVPLNFPFKKFNWKISFVSNRGEDILQDSVDVERSMLIAFIHMVETQKRYPDGRYSNHYFGDAYGVRAMFAYLDFLKRNPKHLLKNKDLWKEISPAIIEKSAIRFCDMLVERQRPDGALPMGYSEHTHGYNVADGGQMVLALAQLSQYVTDEKKRETYLNVCYRFAKWAETFYIDDKKSDSLKTSNPEEYKKGNAKAGLYGLGWSGRSRRETGPSWVLSDILGIQICLAYIDSNKDSKEYKRIAERNVDFYANARYSAAGYYQAEALFWSWLTTKDNSIKQVIEDNLKTTFLKPLYKGKLNDMYDLGSRSTLRALPLLYYQQFIENTAGNRAVLLKYIWSFGSNSSMSSMLNLSYTFPKPVHGESLAATKYSALSALWAMELLEPGSTLYKGSVSKLNLNK